MKLSVKIAATIVLVVALAVSISGYVMLSSDFQNRLDQQISATVDETQLFCTALGTMTVQHPDASSQNDTIVSGLLSTSFFQNYRLSLVSGENMDGTNVRYHIVENQGDSGTVYQLVVVCRFQVAGQEFFLENCRDVTAMYQLQKQNIQTYRLVFSIAVGASLLLGLGLSAYLTGPIRKLSRSTRQIAEGNYSFRAKVDTNDEMGALADQFNHMATELEKYIVYLEESAQKQKDFTASFAHELKTPLTSIIGYADTLRSRKLPEKAQFEATNFIFSEGKRLELMSHSLLRLFALENETPDLRSISTVALMQAVEESVAYPLRERRLVLDVQVENRMVEGEGNLLAILLYNLIDNARKASAPGSKISVLGGIVPEGYCFMVKDRGRGIPKEALSRITEAFYMVDKSRSRAEGGAGLGLALCARIAQLHGTRLRYASREGHGTTVSFILKEAHK